MRWLWGLLLLLGACAQPRCGTAASTPPVAVQPLKAPPCEPLVLHAARGTAALTGELDQPGWHAAEATAAFVARSRTVAPHTEVRAQWDDAALFLVFYSGDDELRAADQVRLELPQGSVEASPDHGLRCDFASVTDCAALGVRAAFDVDGTVDQPGGEDEEWIAELRIPWGAAGPPKAGARLPVKLTRHEVSLRGTMELAWPTGCGALELTP